MLNEILENRKKEVEQAKKERHLSHLEQLIAKRSTVRNFAHALNKDHTVIIAEIKKASPSKGDLNPYMDHIAQGKLYEQGGAAAISVLTESAYFKGSIDYMAELRDNVDLPLLRKDFIFDPYQVYESRAYGADAILLIVASLEPQQLIDLITLSNNLGMQCLVEVHNRQEMKVAVHCGAHIIGINNRDLKTFTVDMDTTRKLCSFIPPGTITVSESGIHSKADMLRLNMWGINAALIGEALVTCPDVLQCIKELAL